MDAKAYTIGQFKGYRFKDITGRGCSIQQSTKGLIIGVNIPEGQSRMHLDEDGAMWLVHVILSYIETGKL